MALGNGLSASQPSLRFPASPGPGGYSGGVGSFGTSPAQPGNGPGGGPTGFIDGGAANGCRPSLTGRGGGFTGNQFLVPLIGGSGGGGIGGATGAAGGGAILIASSTSIAVTGSVNANGGSGDASGPSGSGSGEAIRLAANLIGGNGALTALEGPFSTDCVRSTAGGDGIVRLEASQSTFN